MNDLKTKEAEINQQIEDQRVSIVKAANEAIADSFRQLYDDMSKKMSESIKTMMSNLIKYNKNSKGEIDSMTLDWNKFGDDIKSIAGIAGSQAGAMFGSLLAEGVPALEAAGKAILTTFLDVVSGLVLEGIPAIMTQFITWLGPIAGPIGGALAIAGIQTSLAVAKSAIGKKEGEVDIQGQGTETSDDIPRLVSRRESIMTAKATKARGRTSKS